MPPTGYERDYYANVSLIAKHAGRIAAAVEELAAQGRDPAKVRADNLAALEAEAGRAGGIVTPTGTARLHTEGVCKVNRCLRHVRAGSDFCAGHQDRA